MTARARSAAIAGALVVASCAVSGLDVTGKACPCVDGYVCDVPTNTCVVPGAPGAVDSGRDDGPAPAARIAVSNLRAAWTTANSVHWRWDVSGDPADFSRYEIVTGPSEAVVRDRAPGSRVWRPIDNAELANMRGLDRTLNGDPFDPFTTTDEHAEDTTLFAQVSAFDNAGAATTTNVVEAKTTKPNGNIVIFSDGDMAGTSNPGAFSRSTDRPYRGTHCYALRVGCGAEASCYQRPERSKIAVNAAALSQATFGDAFLEFAVAGDAAVPNFYSDVLLQLGNDTCAGGANACRYRWEGWTFSGADRWRLVQVPLHVLRKLSDNKEMTWADFNAAKELLHAIAFRGTWAGNSTARFDEIRVRF
jgi:hypothetical protein